MLRAVASSMGREVVFCFYPYYEKKDEGEGRMGWEWWGRRYR